MITIDHRSWTAIALVFFIMMMLLAGCANRPAINATYGSGVQSFVLAVGGPNEPGLIAALSEEFARSEPATVQLITVSNNASLELLKAGQVDAVLVHAPVVEEKAVQDGWAVDRTLIGASQFFILGPPDDPAQIRDALCSLDAFRRIHRTQAIFISRGDQSATHNKEMGLWNQARVRPWGDWYVTNDTLMTGGIKKAEEMGGYLLADTSTWVLGTDTVKNLTVLFQGSKGLINTYHALLAPPGTTPAHDTAARFVSFVTSKKGQRIIRDYGKDRYGAPLFQDAAQARHHLEQQ